MGRSSGRWSHALFRTGRRNAWHSRRTKWERNSLFGNYSLEYLHMTKRSSVDIRPQNANPRKSKNRVAAKKAMLAAKAKKVVDNKNAWRKTKAK